MPFKDLRLRRWLVPAALLAMAAMLSGQEAQHKAAAPRMGNLAAMADRVFNPGPAPDPAAVARGEKLFVPTCGFCHGPDATGRSAPDLVRSSVVLEDTNGDKIGVVVHNGRPGKGMPAFSSLTNAQIADIAAFLHSRVRAAANRFAYDMGQIVTGNAAQGKLYFYGAGQCSDCHSVTGDLAGVARKAQPADLQAFMVLPFRSSKPVTADVLLPNGQTVSGTLLGRDHFHVVIRDAAGAHDLPSEGAAINVHDPLAYHQALVWTITDAQMHDLLAYLETLK